MTHDHPTLDFPFGRDVDTLIICENDDHRRRAVKALKMVARYTTIGSAVVGHRFLNIIVLVGKPESATEAAMIDRMAAEYWPTLLERGGEIHFL